MRSTLLLSVFSTYCQAQTVELEFVDDASGKPIAGRIKFDVGEKRVSRPRGVLVEGGWWLAESKFALSPKGGDYEFMVQRGPEFVNVRGGFTVEKKSKDTVLIEVPRSTDMHAENWYSGDHDCRLIPELTRRWQAAEALDCVASLPRDLADNPRTDSESGQTARNHREEGTLQELLEPDVVGLRMGLESECSNSKHGPIILHRIGHSVANLEKTPEADPSQKSTEISGLMNLLRSTIGREGVVPELMTSWARDVPLLLSSKGVRSVQVLNHTNRPLADDVLTISPRSENTGIFGRVHSHLGKDTIVHALFAPLDFEDRLRYKGGRGVGLISEQLFWTMLESGLRLTPTAGSGFGESETHLGYNRIYGFHEQTPDAMRWLQAVSLGQTTITNGPLLRTLVNQLPPGTTQSSSRGTPIDLDIDVSLTVREPVDYLDVLFNGEPLYSAKLEEHHQRNQFPPLQIEESGWLVIRVITAHEKGYRMATTAPFYFEFDGKPRISKKACEFMLAWLKNAASNIKQNPEDWNDYAAPMIEAHRFWTEQISKATAP
ncbi:MAG: hypothetical protein KGQ60_03560 [Planctomycetes bacterium]|nr:hypothetical protein [Planctomycetota bacterium]